MTATSGRLAVLIITLEEELTLPISLGSIRRHLGNVPVLVLDSNSIDRTCEVAQQYGAMTQQRKFDGYARQRNHGLAMLRDCDWVLMLDADEEVTPEFAAELNNFLETAGEHVDMALFRRRDYFMGRWIRRSSGYPTWFGRIVRPRKVTVAREINEEYLCTGKKVSLQGHINHYPFSKGLGHWVEKHNRYSTAEAVLAVRERRPVRLADFVSKDKTAVRAALKAIYMRLPCRPLLGFLYLYVVRLGFLDGRAGFHFCTLRFIYECLINLKAFEEKTQNRSAHT